MSRIQARDSYEYPYPPQKVYSILADIPGYKSWWPGEFRVRILEQTRDHLHAKIEVWASGGWFRCETTALNFPHRVDIRYYQGVVLGESWWDLEELANGNTKVSYSINLEPHGRVMGYVARIINISALHSFQFQRVLKRLHRHLDSLQAQES
ncbi:oligoketide cyclase/lipid transport protein [Desulfitobacterium dichloroeliminans LMG P-21439]|uniref:Oligoketide cyclase/lipid transport protein n=1 Tax=Desulfitobacterium dichloroeliminans (strain LMG P-21439 / DCA1) TaxID=871963 RepID=L0F9Y1_DESDL|nr:SRPBCC family protein [Desulfitobacterium dichloroeliminans]AGA69466.1 oligoketide cyclase/lipid transport protein [Desulfitobacterium dichloroeliminans LMG P-21439]